jgi:LCP family protein required for cell wall assembly
MLWRFLLAGFLVISFAAATTAVAGLLQINTFTQYFNVNPSIRGADVTIPDPGNPQTILVIGSDHRAGEPFSAANTDTMMLVRLDPSSSTINVLSVPRDLKVTLPGSSGGQYYSKINAAYSVGGPALLLKVLKHQVFPGLKVNHIVDVNFGGFVALVNAIGCVYTDVDHRYYNNTAITDYSSIDLQPGYQKLCGNDALSFVRFRHTDNDIVRNARQQDFIRWAKAQYSGSQLVDNRNKLMKIFGEHAQTDHNLHTTDGLLNLFDLVAFSAGHTIKQIKFPAILDTCGAACYVTANRGPLRSAFNQFMTPTHPGSGGGGGHKPKAHNTLSGLTADVSDGRTQATALAHAGIPVYYPRVIAAGSQYCTNSTCTIGPVANSYPRAYTIPDQGGHRHPAYRITLVVNPALGQYYGVQGTTWPNPPILNGTHQTKTVKGRQLQIYFNGHKPTLVAWRTPSGVYWISNTLTDDLSISQLTAIAASLTRA